PIFEQGVAGLEMGRLAYQVMADGQIMLFNRPPTHRRQDRSRIQEGAQGRQLVAAFGDVVFGRHARKFVMSVFQNDRQVGAVEDMQDRFGSDGLTEEATDMSVVPI